MEPAIVAHFVHRSLSLLLNVPPQLRTPDILNAIQSLEHYFRDNQSVHINRAPSEKSVKVQVDYDSLPRTEPFDNLKQMHLQDSAVELSTVDLARKQALRKGKPTPHQPKEPSDRQFSFPRLHDPPENYSFDGETEKLDVDTSLAIKTLQRAITSRQMTLQRQETKPHFVQVSSDVPASKVLFSAHDIDNSGGISASELRGLVYSMGFYLSDAEAAIAVEKLDPDGDGEIQYHNFLKWWQSDNRFDKLRATQKQGELIQSATEYFQYYDIEENGYVDDAQFRKMFDDMMHYNLYFAQDTTYEQAKQQIMSKNAVHVTFNDYIAWLFRIGVIATA